MEIKQGDKVRVSEDVPKILFNRSICNYPEYVFEVREVENGYADIYYGAGKIPLAAFVIPTKYLVKVDAEAKSKDNSCRWEGKIVYNCKSHKSGGIIRIVEGGAEVITEYGERRIWPLMDLLDEYDNPFEKWKCDEPTEQTEAEKKPNVGSITIPVEVDLTDSYWDAYTADLAREIAVKSMEKSYGCDPERIADYAVSVAKAVVEGLKRK